MAESDEPRPPDLIPVTVLTGFLGAGKTTLLNRLLRRPELNGAAVLINEFGEVGLDHLMVEALDADTVLLSSGCLCCTVRGDLVKALERVVPKRPNRIVVETTGLADPAPIIQTLMGDHYAAMHTRLDGIVTVVDAVNGDAQLDAQPEALKQAAVADRIVLSKTDLPQAADTLPHLRARLAALNPVAPVLTAAGGEIDPAALLDAGLFSVDGKIPDVGAWLNEEGFAGKAHGRARGDGDPGADHGDAHGHGHAHGHEHDHGHDAHLHDVNRHDSSIRAVCLTFEKPLKWQGIGTWLETLIAMRGESLLRVKAILNLEGQDRPVALHGVQHLFHPPALLPGWPEGDPRTSRIVVILKDLDPKIIEDGLRAFQDAA